MLLRHFVCPCGSKTREGPFRSCPEKRGADGLQPTGKGSGNAARFNMAGPRETRPFPWPRSPRAIVLLGLLGVRGLLESPIWVDFWVDSLTVPYWWTSPDDLTTLMDRYPSPWAMAGHRLCRSEACRPCPNISHLFPNQFLPDVYGFVWK